MGRSRVVLTASLVALTLAVMPLGERALAQTKPRAKRTPHSAPRAASPSRSASSAAEQDLERLARALHDQPTGIQYQRLAQFAMQHAGTLVGERAALALGYYDFGRNHFAEARKWLEDAEPDPLLGDYALYWEAQNDRAAGANDIALAELKRYRQRYPDSAVSDAAVEALARTALAADQPDEALAALAGYPATATKPALLLLRAQAREKAAEAKKEKPLDAAADYLALVYGYPLSDEAKIAQDRVVYLRLILGEQFPGTPVDLEVARAEAFYDAKRWKDLRAAYQALLPKLSGSARERAQLRIAQAQLQMNDSSGAEEALMSLPLTDPELDAERIFTISQIERSAKVESEMLASIEQLVSLHPHSSWAEQALFAGGNYYWANFDRPHAVPFYQRVVESFADSRDAPVAQWRIVWTAYLNREPDVAGLLESYLRQYPSSSYTVDALYWLGRASERSGNAALARSLYLAATRHFPQTYFAECAARRLQEIGSAPVAQPDFLSALASVPPLPSFDDPLPVAAAQVWSRAMALESIALEGPAGTELRAGYAATHEPKLLLAAAQADIADGHYSQGIVAARQVITQLDSRQFEEVPLEAWRTVYPLPYRDSLEREAARNHVDPMFVAGLIRQESAFASDAVSFTGCCFGLMQVKPSTGVRLARGLRVRFSRTRLFDPEYNLKLGSVYIANLLTMFGTPEAALAAYNAGEDRVVQWTDGQNYQEIAEFVESIPFTQTREYVQIVSRNAELYREIYRRGTASALAASVQHEQASSSPSKASTR